MSERHTGPVTRRHVFAVAWPIILSNLSTPLLGFVDTGVIGNLGDPAKIGAIALGALIFSFLYWGFGFLRMGTTALVAQAFGADDRNQLEAAVLRALLLGGVIGFGIVLLRNPIAHLAFGLTDGSQGVENAAQTYFLIRIWGAPLFLAQLAVLGMLLGTQDTRSLLLVQLLLNGTNIGLDLLFVVHFGWGVAGVAAATVIAEAVAFAAGMAIIWRRLPGLTRQFGQLFERAAMRRMFSMNFNIMIRTLTLTFGFAWFTNQGAKSGDVILAGNAILMQLVTFSAYFIDGFALAAETLVGQATGALAPARLKAAIRAAVEWSLLTSIMLGGLFFLLGPVAFRYLTNIEAVIATCTEYLPWVVAIPLVSMWCYMLDGIFIGASRTGEMRNAMLAALAIYLGAWAIMHPHFGNHGLWASLVVFYLARAGCLLPYLPRITATHTPR